MSEMKETIGNYDKKTLEVITKIIDQHIGLTNRTEVQDLALKLVNDFVYFHDNTNAVEYIKEWKQIFQDNYKFANKAVMQHLINPEHFILRNEGSEFQIDNKEGFTNMSRMHIFMTFIYCSSTETDTAQYGVGQAMTVFQDCLADFAGDKKFIEQKVGFNFTDDQWVMFNTLVSAVFSYKCMRVAQTYGTRNYVVVRY